MGLLGARMVIGLKGESSGAGASAPLVLVLVDPYNTLADPILVLIDLKGGLLVLPVNPEFKGSAL